MPAPFINMPSPFTDGRRSCPIDAIQEFNLMENPKAEYGWKPGAIVNVGIKSGTNTLHGDGLCVRPLPRLGCPQLLQCRASQRSLHTSPHCRRHGRAKRRAA